MRKGEKKKQAGELGSPGVQRPHSIHPGGTPGFREPRAGCLNTPSLPPLLLSTACAWALGPGLCLIHDGHIPYYSNQNIPRVKGVVSNNHARTMGINYGCPGHRKAGGHPLHKHCLWGGHPECGMPARGWGYAFPWCLISPHEGDIPSKLL